MGSFSGPLVAFLKQKYGVVVVVMWVVVVGVVLVVIVGVVIVTVVI
jgi:hypothetical protein